MVLRYEHGIGKPLAKSDCHHNVKDKMGVAAVNFYFTYDTPKYFVFFITVLIINCTEHFILIIIIGIPDIEIKVQQGRRSNTYFNQIIEIPYSNLFA